MSHWSKGSGSEDALVIFAPKEIDGTCPLRTDVREFPVRDAVTHWRDGLVGRVVANVDDERLFELIEKRAGVFSPTERIRN